MADQSDDFVYLSVESFRKLTTRQKQQYVEALKQHLDQVLEAQSARPADTSA